MTNQEFSHVIVGARSAGCVLAAHLSAQSVNRVLLLEAGPVYASAATPSEVSSPNNFGVVAGTDYVWPVTVSLTSEQSNVPFAQGCGVGGSSAINNTWALRPRPGDVRRWRSSHPSPVTWAELEAALIATERDTDFGDAVGHGSDGPLVVSRLPEATWRPVDHAFRTSLLDAGFPWSQDLSGLDAIDDADPVTSGGTLASRH